MEYQYPASDKGYAPPVGYEAHGRFWEVDKSDIYKALAQVESEEKLPFEKLLAKLRKELDKTTHGTAKERESYEQYFNQVIGYRLHGGYYCHVRKSTLTKSYGKVEILGEISLYDGLLKDYWYTVLGIARKPEVYALPEPERLIEFL